MCRYCGAQCAGKKGYKNKIALRVVLATATIVASMKINKIKTIMISMKVTMPFNPGTEPNSVYFCCLPFITLESTNP